MACSLWTVLKISIVINFALGENLLNSSLVSTGCQLLIDGRTTVIQSNHTTRISPCMSCTCINQTVQCYQNEYDFFKQQYNQTTLCSNCKSIFEVICLHCIDHEGTIRYHQEDWKQKSCMSCWCSNGRTLCEYAISSNNTVGPFIEFHLGICKICNEEVDPNLHLYTCVECQDGSINRTLLEPWKIYPKPYNSLTCFCTLNGIICGDVYHIEGIPIKYECENCTSESYIQSYNEGCTFRGIHFNHRDFKHVNMYGTAICFECACFFNQIACRCRHITYQTCYGVERCNKMASSKITVDACSRSVGLDCPLSPVSWSNNGCYYTCYQGQLTYSVLSKPWCQSLTGVECSECPELQEFLQTYNSTIFQCKSGQYIWNDRVCDTLMDCDDRSDEMNCSTYYCSMDVSPVLQITRTYTPVNDSFITSCEIIPDANLTGLIRSKCIMNADRQTVFTYEDFCGCVDSKARHEILKTYERSKLNQTLLGEVVFLLLYMLNTGRDTNFLYEFMNQLFQEIPYNVSSRTEYSLFLAGVKLLRENNCENTRTKVLGQFIRKKLEELNVNISDSIKTTSLKFPYASLQYSSTRVNELEELLAAASRRLHLKSLGNSSEQHTNLSQFKFHQRTIETFEQYHGKIIVDVEHITACFSIVCLLFGLIFFHIFKIKNTRKIIIHKNLMAVYLVSTAIDRIPNWIIQDLHKSYRKWCTTVSILTYYGSLALFTWMMLEGINLILILVLVFKQKNKRLKEIFLCGYGLPLVITSMALAINWKSFEETHNCLSPKGSLWIIKGPLAFFLTINTIEMIIILSVLVKSMKISSKIQQSKRTGSSIKAFLLLVPLLGLSFLIGLFIEYEPAYLGYIYVICNGATSFLLVLFHCLFDPKIYKHFTIMKNRLLKKKVSFCSPISSRSYDISSRRYDISKKYTTTEL